MSYIVLVFPLLNLNPARYCVLEKCWVVIYQSELFFIISFNVITSLNDIVKIDDCRIFAIRAPGTYLILKGGA